MRVAGREMWVAGREMRVTIAKCRGIGEFSGVRLAYVIPMAYPWRTFVTPLSLRSIDFIFRMVLV